MPKNDSFFQEGQPFFRSGKHFYGNVRILCRLSILTALYVLLTMVSIRAGNLRITFASLPLVVCALLFGPWQAATVALMGEFMNQMLSYGFTATTALWLIPPAVRALVIGAAAVRASSARRMPEDRPVFCYVVCALAAIATTVCNTAVICVDALIYHYFTPVLIYGDLLVRLGTGLLTSVVVASVAMPLTHLLRRQQTARSL
ncbi:MAG: folate family ECF transporter S component [Oscillibacter sp.]|jgi:ECF transporter S component (folate family)|nr:folate family ECF transporter S component [Oscillibacter sp.]